MMKFASLLLLVAAVRAQNCCPMNAALCEDPRMAALALPPGFCINQFASLSGARTLDVHSDPVLGTVVFVGVSRGANTFVLVDANGDGRSDRTIQFSTGANTAHTASMRHDKLYLGQRTRLVRFDNIMELLRAGQTPGNPVVMFTGFGTGGTHADRVIAWGRNGTDMYISQGSPCNTCVPTGIQGEILKVPNVHDHNTLQLSDFEAFALGLRNSVGMTTSPDDTQLWFTDNGRDNWGDNRPADELNFADFEAPQQHFGFPYCYGYGDADTQYNPSGSCVNYTPSAVELGPHVASLGLTFASPNMFPPPYNSGLFIAEHGSWNRRPFIGFRVTHVPLAEDGTAKAFDYEPLLEGFLTNPTLGSRWGRPADVANLPDGSLLVADDTANVVWRISYGAKRTW